VEEKKPNLLFCPGPPRSGTTYLYELVSNHSNQEFRNSIQPPRGWKFADHNRDLYWQGKVATQAYYLTKMRIKENKMTSPNIIDLFERCLHVQHQKKEGLEVDNTQCHRLMKGWYNNFPKEADWHLAMVPHVANSIHLYTYSKTYMDLLDNDMSENILTAQQICDVTSECIELARNLYQIFFEQLASSGMYNKIEIVIPLRDPKELFISNLKNAELIATNVANMTSRDHLDNSPIALLHRILTGKSKENVLEFDTASSVNQSLLYHVSVIRIYEQFTELSKYFENNPNVDVKFLNTDIMNDPYKLANTISAFDVDNLKQSTIFGKKINSAVEGFVPEENSHEYFSQEHKETQFSDHHKFIPGTVKKLSDATDEENEMLYYDFLDALIELKDSAINFIPCCSFVNSERFVEQQNAILDK
jgi:hypothetical protein